MPLYRRVTHHVKKIALVAILFGLAAGGAFAGLNSKEVGAILVYPEFRAGSTAENLRQPMVDTYLSITNDRSTGVGAHFQVIDGHDCGVCDFNLPLTGFQTRRLRRCSWAR